MIPTSFVLFVPLTGRYAAFYRAALRLRGIL